MVMSKKLFGFLISTLILLPTLCMTTGSVQASPALNVGLTRFGTIPLENAMRLKWDTEAEPSQTGDSGVAVAFVQEDPASYPEPDPLEGESLDAALDDTSNDLEARIKTGENPDRPEVIGTNQYPADNQPSGSDSEVQNTETAVPTGGLAGKIYLWVAFVAAVFIFTAAVLGAILLYTRQRYKE